MSMQSRLGWLAVALAVLPAQTPAKPPSGGGGGGGKSGKAAFVAGETKGGKGSSGSLTSTLTGDSPWVAYAEDLNARRLSWKDATANLTQLGTGRVRDFQLDSTSLTTGWVLTEKHLSRNTGLTSGGSWSVRFDAGRFEEVTGLVPSAFAMVQLQSHREKAGYQLLLAYSGGSLYLFRTSDGGDSWGYVAFGGSSGDVTLLKAGNMDACQVNDDVYVSVLYSRPVGDSVEEFVRIFTIRDLGGSLSVDYDREVPSSFGPQLTLGSADNGASCDLWLAGYDAMLKSSDQGANWTQLAVGITPQYPDLLGLQIHERIQGAPGSATDIFAGVLGLSGSGSLSFARTSDGFGSAQSIDPASGGGVLRPAAFFYGGAAAAYANFSTVDFLRQEGDSLVYYSTDGGASWSGKSGNLASVVCDRYTRVDRSGHTCFQILPVSIRVQP